MCAGACAIMRCHSSRWTSAPNPTCAKCGQPGAAGAGFCPNCGTATRRRQFAPRPAAVRDRTMLPTAVARPPADATPAATTHRRRQSRMPRRSARPASSPRSTARRRARRVRAGDGPFQAGPAGRPALHDPEAARHRRHGRRLPGVRSRARRRRGDQGDPARRAVGRDRREGARDSASSASSCWRARSRTSTSSAFTTSARSTASST